MMKSAKPIEISSRTLEMMDKAVDNLMMEKVSKPVDMEELKKLLSEK